MSKANNFSTYPRVGEHFLLLELSTNIKHLVLAETEEKKQERKKHILYIPGVVGAVVQTAMSLNTKFCVDLPKNL